MKIKPPMEGYEMRLVRVEREDGELRAPADGVDEIERSTPKHPPMPQGHPVIIDGDDGKKWVLFGDPLPTLRCPATFEAWQDPATVGECSRRRRACRRRRMASRSSRRRGRLRGTRIENAG